ncbi:MAG: hypothetical protein ACHQ53_16100 [Polyangiales bacterium]
MSERKERGVVLPEGYTGSSLFHRVLVEAAESFPDVLAAARLPETPGAFKREYGAALARFEAERAASPRRVEIARFIAQRTQQALMYQGDAGVLPLVEHMARRLPLPELHARPLSGSVGIRAEVPFDGQLYRGREVIELAERLHAESQLTSQVVDALRFMVEQIEARGGALDLRGERFVILGAGAELAPTRLLLQAGASVLWVDVAEPEQVLADASALAGTLVQTPSARNLLEAPAEIAAAVTAFAASGPVHIATFAYASGASREWRLGAAMNAIVTSLPPTLVRSVSLLVSPTTCATIQPECAAAAERAFAERPAWQSALHRIGLLPAPGHHQAHGVRIGLCTVSIQGVSYQAAQYISKLASAETYALHGIDLGASTPQPVTVSANVAGITRTRSLSHPLFEAAFIGAPRFSVRIFDPPTTRALSGLLILHDLLNPAAPGAAAVQNSDPRQKAFALFSQQVHGGIYSLPYVLDHAIRAAAVIGMASKPSLLLRR